MLGVVMTVMYSYFAVPLFSIELCCTCYLCLCRVNSSVIDEKIFLVRAYHTGPCLSGTAWAEEQRVTAAIVNVND
jgi:hypothetical protein